LWFKLRVEERMMRDTFGAAYDEYARRVSALVPFVL
jgi:protein-S-isoprenylcysteine O-methyltransferase Ste14